VGRIDPGVVEQLLSYPGVSRNDATVDYLLSSAEDEIEDVYEDVLARVFVTGVVTPKVMRMILTARLKYLQHVIPMCELLSLSNPTPEALESLRELNDEANEFFSRIRPNAVGDLLPTSQR
jgi:ferritin-like protein